VGNPLPRPMIRLWAILGLVAESDLAIVSNIPLINMASMTRQATFGSGHPTGIDPTIILS
jgi:hypothetical protein